MSFPKASLKRFNENTGCAPPVGSYDPKQKEKAVVHGFDKGGDRFKAPKDLTPGPGAFETEVPKKTALLNSSTCSNGNEKKKMHRSQDNLAEMIKIKDLEREIKKLVQERANQDKLLSHREEDIVKLEGKLHTAQTDKSSLQARIASVEKELKEIKKSNEVLKNKIHTADNSAKKHENLLSELSTLKHQVECKNKEISCVKHELESILNHQSCDLQIFHNLVVMLEDKTRDFKRKGSEEVTYSRKTIEKLQKRFDEAVQEIEKKIQSYKENLNKMAEDKLLLEQSLKQKETELMENKEKAETLELSRNTLSKQYTSLQKMIKDMKTENWDNYDQIRYLKGEIFTKEDCLKEDSQILFEVRAEKASLLEKLEVLEEENGTLNENIKTLTEKYHVIETRLAEEQNQNNVKSDQIQSQLDVTKCHLMEVQDQYQSVLSKNKQLVQSINTEKGYVEKLTYQLDEQTQILAGLQSLVDSKEDTITDLEISLEATKVELQNVMDTVEVKEADILELKDKIETLEVIESSMKTQFEQEKNINQTTARQHADRILTLEQEEITLKEELDKVRSEKVEIDRKMTELGNDLKQVLSDKERSKEQITLLQGELNHAKLERQEGEHRYKQLDTKFHSLNKENTQLMNEVEFLQVSKQRTENEMSEQIENLTAELVENQNYLVDVKARDSELDNEKLELTSQLEKVTSEKEALSKQFTDLVTSLEDVRNKSSVKESEWEADYERLTSELQTVTEERDILKQRISALDEEKSALKEVIQHLEIKIDDIEQGSKREIESFTETVDNLLASKEELVHEGQTLKSVNQTLQTALDEKLNQTQSLENDVEKLTQEMHVYKDFKVRYESKVKEMSSLEEDFKSKVSQIDLLEMKLQDIDSGKEMLTQQVSDMDRLVGSLKAEVNRLTVEIDSKKSLIDAITTKYNEELDNLKATVASYEANNSDLNKAVNNLESNLKNKEEETLSYQRQLDELKEKLCHKEEDIVEYQEKIGAFDVLVCKHHAEISTYQNKVSELESDLDMREEEIRMLVDEKEEHARRYEDELADLRDKVDVNGGNNWKQMYDDIMKKVGPFMEQLDQFELERAALLGRSEFAQAELDRLSQAYGKVLGHQNHKQKIKHIQNIKEENNSLKKEITSLREQLFKIKRNNTTGKLQKENGVPIPCPLKEGNRK